MGHGRQGRIKSGTDDKQRAIKIKMRGTCSGIYKITTPSGRSYVGSSQDIRARARKHCYELRTGRHKNGKLQRSFDKYGTLVLEPIYRCAPKDLEKWEQIFIDELEPSINICPVAFSCLGKKHKPETIEKFKKIAKERGYEWLKQHHFKKGKDNPMQKGKRAKCHEATSIPVIAKKEGCKPMRFKSMGSASRVFHVDESVVRKRVNGKVASSLSGWMFEVDA